MLRQQVHVSLARVILPLVAGLISLRFFQEHHGTRKKMPHKLFQNVLDDVSYIISRFRTCLSWGLLTSVLPSIGGLRTTSMVSKHHTPHKVQFLDRDRNMGKWPACLAMPCHDDTVYGLYGQAILHQLGCLLGFPSRNNGTIITHRIHVWYTV